MRRKGIIKSVIISLMLLLGSFIGMKILIAQKKKPERVKLAVQPLRVKVWRVKKRDIMLKLKGWGTTMATKQVNIVPEVSGRVVYVSPYFRSGARVRRGQLLFRIDSQVYRLNVEQLRNQYKSLGHQIEIAKRSLALDMKYLQRNRRLVQRHALDKGNFERLHMMTLDRSQRLESLKQMRLATKIQLKNALIRLSKTNVRAPFEGRITRANLSRGNFVAQGRPVGNMENSDAVEISVAFPLSSLREIRDKDGEPIDIEKLPAYFKKMPWVKVRQSDDPRHLWEGRVVRVGARLDFATRTIPLWVRIELDTPTRRGRLRKRRHGIIVNRRTLLPGVFCQVEIPIRQFSNVFVIPNRALYGDSVYVSVNDRLERRRVIVAHRGAENSILKGGLREGELLVISAMEMPEEGRKIHPIYSSL